MKEEHRDAKSGSDESTIAVACPRCLAKLKCSRDLLGTKGQCRKCQYIFEICEKANGLDKVIAKQKTTSIAFTFNCPRCNQLFEGQEAMAGRKGKCHNCGEVFFINLEKNRIPDLPPPLPPTVSNRPAKPAQPSNIRFSCTYCRGILEVPGDTSGMTTACPFCQQLLHIP